MPATDLNGDGNRETVLFNDERVILLRLDETSAAVSVSAIGDWACENKASQ